MSAKNDCQLRVLYIRVRCDLVAFALHALEQRGAPTCFAAEDEEGGLSVVSRKEIQQLTGVFGWAVVKGEGYRPWLTARSDDLACRYISGLEGRGEGSGGKSCQNESHRGMHLGKYIRLL